MCADKVGFVFVGEGESVYTCDGVDRLSESVVEDGCCGKGSGVNVGT